MIKEKKKICKTTRIETDDLKSTVRLKLLVSYETFQKSTEWCLQDV